MPAVNVELGSVDDYTNTLKVALKTGLKVDTTLGRVELDPNTPTVPTITNNFPQVDANSLHLTAANGQTFQASGTGTVDTVKLFISAKIGAGGGDIKVSICVADPNGAIIGDEVTIPAASVVIGAENTFQGLNASVVAGTTYGIHVVGTAGDASNRWTIKRTVDTYAGGTAWEGPPGSLVVLSTRDLHFVVVGALVTASNMGTLLDELGVHLTKGLGQTFQATWTGTIDRVRLDIGGKHNGGSGDLTLSIRATDPNGAIIGNAVTIPAASLTASSINTFIGLNAPVVAGTTYGIRLCASTGDPNNEWRIRRSSDTYAGGTAWEAVGGCSSTFTQVTTRDHRFMVLLKDTGALTGTLKSLNLAPVNGKPRLFTYDATITPPGVLTLQFSLDGSTYGSPVAASSGVNSVDLVAYFGTVTSGAFYYQANFSRPLNTDPTPILSRSTLVYDLDVSEPTLEVEVVDKNGVTRTLASGALEVLSLDVTLEDRKGLDSFTLLLRNRQGAYRNYFEATKAVRLYLGYNGTNTRVLYGLILGIDFDEPEPGRHHVALAGKGWKALLASRHLTGTRSFTNQGAGQILASLLSEYLPQATSGLDPSGILGGEATLDASQTQGSYERQLLQANPTDMDQMNQVQYTPTTGFSFDFFGSQWAAQSFTTGAGVTSLPAFAIRLKKFAGAGDLEVAIRATLTGADLASRTFTADTLRDGAGHLIVTLSPALTVSPSTTYYIILRSPTSTPTARYQISDDLNQSYAAGQTHTSNNSGSSWTNEPKDAVFITFKANPGHATGQTWTTGAGAVNLLRVRAYLWNVNYGSTLNILTGDVTCDLYATDGSGNPTGPSLGTARIPATTLPAGGWVDLNFNPVPTITPNTKYFIEIKAPTDALHLVSELRIFYFDDGLSGGDLWFVDSGTRTIQPGKDLRFETYYATDLLPKIDFAETDTVLTAGQKLAETFGKDLYVDAQRVVHFEPQGQVASNYMLRDTKCIELAHTGRSILEQFATFVKIRGSLEEISVVDEVKTGIPATKTHAVAAASDPLFKGIKNPIGTVEVKSGGSYVVKEENVDFTVNYTTGKVTFVTAPPAVTDAIRWDYTWLRKTEKTASDAPAQAAYGRWDLVETVPHILSGSQAQDWADGLLAAHKNPKMLGELDLNIGLQDLRVGSIVWIEVPDSDHNGEFKVAQVRHTYQNGQFKTSVVFGQVRRGPWEYIEGLLNRLADQEGGNLE